MIIQNDGRTVETRVNIPTGWETPEVLRNRSETFTFDIVEGSPRFLRITSVDSAAVEDFVEGDWPEPTDGLTAHVRAFGSTGSIYDAYCEHGDVSGTWNRSAVWDFARGGAPSTDPTTEDIVAGAHFDTWANGVGAHAVIDIAGFDQLGGTTLIQADNYVVRFTGALAHDGFVALRERDDSYDDMGAWVLLDGERTSPVFEIFHFRFQDDDETVTVPGLLSAGTIPIEVIVVRCADAGDVPFDLEVSFNSASGPFGPLGATRATPEVSGDLFPTSF